MIEKNIPDTDCKVCGVNPCDDWMYRCGLVPQEHAICGECKVKMGNEIMEGLQEKIFEMFKPTEPLRE